MKKLAALVTAALLVAAPAHADPLSSDLQAQATQAFEDLRGQVMRVLFPPRATLTQGDAVYSPKSWEPNGRLATESLCTTGLADTTRHIAFVAAHCGFDGQVVRNEAGQRVGTLHHLHPGFDINRTDDPANIARDVAYIAVDPDVALVNTFSAGVLPASELFDGREVCGIGVSTPFIHCGRIEDPAKYGLPRSASYVVTNLKSHPGDSGGPLWDLHTGQFIGTLSLGSPDTDFSAYVITPGQ